MQSATDRPGGGSCHAHRVSLLEARNAVANVRGVHPVDRAAIIAEPVEIALHRRDVSDAANDFLSVEKPVRRPPMMAGREVGLVAVRHLMEQTNIVTRRDWIGWAKNLVVLGFDKNQPGESGPNETEACNDNQRNS